MSGLLRVSPWGRAPARPHTQVALSICPFQLRADKKGSGSAGGQEGKNRKNSRCWNEAAGPAPEPGPRDSHERPTP